MGQLTERRTQEERSQQTRTKLLDATIECLVDLGYARTTTTEVAKRSGHSRGAQLHHFPTKADLVEAAVEHLASRISAEYRKQVRKLPNRADKMTATVDTMWKVAAGPLFAAVVELLVVARTDPTVRAALDTFYVAFRQELSTSFQEVFGDEPQPEQVRQLLELSIAVVNGLALEQAVNGLDADGLIDHWKQIVVDLLAED